ncbi:hypothetical protein BDF20DRAFT_867556 [Mycotypha africana]|uniref:uncharacterized protein n=1 Tax=Mycotypha africana TaxID=64632 RepID=UPI0023016FBD|nr:uncharacterized protein BDF20DRAFT_867556 [Mycotypha africana]KAI8979086.1 hypothetical protein BDF20DRAFT_867556 [Mycotypha africana]
MILDRNQQLYTEQKNNCHENYFSLPPPPSYSTVIAEKQWTEKLDEINELLLTLRLSIQDIYFMMTMYRHYYQRVELKSQYLLDMLKKKSPHSPLRKARSSSSCNVLSSQSIETVQVDDDDDEEREEEALITRMNQTMRMIVSFIVYSNKRNGICTANIH